jgi:rubrerythrin
MTGNFSPLANVHVAECLFRFLVAMSLFERTRRKGMQESQKTNTSNTSFNLVSVLYHALEEAQTTNAYIQDAQQQNNPELVSFFQEIQQQANSRAQHAHQLLDQIEGSSHSTKPGGPDTSEFVNNPDAPGGASF